MKSLPTQAILGAGAAVLAAFSIAMPGAFAIGLVSAVGVAVLAFVAFVAQSERLSDEQRLVYRPVYARRHGVQHRVRSED